MCCQSLTLNHRNGSSQSLWTGSPRLKLQHTSASCKDVTQSWAKQESPLPDCQKIRVMCHTNTQMNLHFQSIVSPGTIVPIPLFPQVMGYFTHKYISQKVASQSFAISAFYKISLPGFSWMKSHNMPSPTTFKSQRSSEKLIHAFLIGEKSNISNYASFNCTNKCSADKSMSFKLISVLWEADIHIFDRTMPLPDL